MIFFLSSVNLWWATLSNFQQIIFIIASAASIILVLQFILLLFGLGDHCDFDISVDVSDVDVFNDAGLTDTSSMRIVSFRGIIAFLAVGGWVCYTCVYFIKWYYAAISGVASGTLAAIVVAYLMNSMQKFQSSGNREMANALGLVADVYLTIPANRSGSGKVHVVVQESLTECEAITDNDIDIKTGDKCIISEVINEQLVLVKPFIADSKSQ